MPDIINTLLDMDDTALAQKLGFTQKVTAIKEDLGEADKLTGKARELVVERIQEMMSPNVYPDAIEYAIRDAKRQTGDMTKGEAMSDPREADPASLMDD